MEGPMIGLCNKCGIPFNYRPIVRMNGSAKRRFTNRQLTKLLSSICPVCCLDEVLYYRKVYPQDKEIIDGIQGKV
jgi:hypothetical protein